MQTHCPWAEAKHSESGFTLLEMMISMVLLTMVSLSIAFQTVSSFKTRQKVYDRGDFLTNIRMAVEIMDRDISNLYSPIIMVPPKPSPTVTSAPGGAPPIGVPPTPTIDPDLQVEYNQESDFWHKAVGENGIRPSRFRGEPDAIHFISTSHNRIYRGSKESEFAKVTYELRDDKFPDQGLEDTKVLVKVEDHNAFSMDDEDDELRRVYPILKGVTKLEFQFLHVKKPKNSWEKRWDTEREEFRKKYPAAIKVNLEVKGQNQVSFAGEFEIRREVPTDGIPLTY